MKKWMLLIIAIMLVLVGCEKRDNSNDIKKEYMSLLNRELNKGELKNYIPELFTENQKLIITSGLPSLFSFIVLHEKNEKRVHFC